MGPDPPPAPDYTPVLQAQQAQATVDTAQAEKQFQLGEDQLQLQRQAFQKAADQGDAYFKAYQDQQAQNKALFGEVWPQVQSEMASQADAAKKAGTYLDQQIASADTATARSGYLWDRFTNTLVPVQDKLINFASNYMTPARSDQDAAAAEANVRLAGESAINNADAQLASYGIDPSQGRSRALDLAGRVTTAAGTAAAGTLSRIGTEQRGTQLLGAVSDITQGMPSTALSAQNLSSGLGTAGFGAANTTGVAGVNAGLTGVSTGNSLSPATTLGSMALNPYTNALGPFGTSGSAAMNTGGALSGYAGNMVSAEGNTLSTGFNNAMQQYTAERQNSTDLIGGIGKIVGGIGGLALGGPVGGMFGSSIFGGGMGGLSGTGGL